jgi:predicted N-formylglutamate amidohydrolase
MSTNEITSPSVDDHSESFDALNPDGDHRFLLICDHASNRLPAEYGTLGLDAAEIDRHIAYDIGAGALTRELSKILNAPAVLSRFSRLLIDPNRGLDDPTLIMKLSDGAIIPGNRHLSAKDAQDRIDRFYKPYHQAIDRHLNQTIDRGVSPVLVSLHSFTPVWRGQVRPWQIGILWDKDDRLSRPLIERLRREPGLRVGDNEPYSGELENDCMNQHGTRRGLGHSLIEMRQDLIQSSEGVLQWAHRLVGVLNDVLDFPI